jgi:hypothetical protein
MTKSDLKHSLKYIEKFYANMKDTKAKYTSQSVFKHTVEEISSVINPEDGQLAIEDQDV